MVPSIHCGPFSVDRIASILETFSDIRTVVRGTETVYYTPVDAKHYNATFYRAVSRDVVRLLAIIGEMRDERINIEA